MRESVGADVLTDPLPLFTFLSIYFDSPTSRPTASGIGPKASMNVGKKRASGRLAGLSRKIDNIYEDYYRATRVSGSPASKGLWHTQNFMTRKYSHLVLASSFIDSNSTSLPIAQVKVFWFPVAIPVRLLQLLTHVRVTWTRTKLWAPTPSSDQILREA
jgi:hypothetical protein